MCRGAYDVMCERTARERIGTYMSEQAFARRQIVCTLFCTWNKRQRSAKQYYLINIDLFEFIPKPNNWLLVRGAFIFFVCMCVRCDVIDLMKLRFNTSGLHVRLQWYFMHVHCCLFDDATRFRSVLACYLRMKWATAADTATSYRGTWCLRGPNVESNLFFYICPVVLLCIAL